MLCFDSLGKAIKQGTKAICRTMVQRPLLHLTINWCIIISMTFLVLGGGFLNLHSLVFNDFLISNEEDVQEFFSRVEAVERSSESLEQVSFRSRPSIELAIFHLYESESLFSAENIQAICETERTLLAHPDYPFYCHTLNANGIDTECLPQINAVSTYFYNVSLGCPLLSEDEILFGREVMTNSPQGATLFDDIDNPSLLRSTLVLGTPLGADSPPGRNFSTPVADVVDEEAQVGHALLVESYMNDLYDTFDVDHVPPFQNAWDRDFFKFEDADVEIKVYGGLIEFLHVDEMLIIDQFIVVLSFFCVLCVVWLYVKSFFLACTGLVSITLTMIVGLFFYAVLFQIDYFTTLHVVSFFIILAIGANNFYVVFDAWKQSETAAELHHDEEQFLINRLEYAYTRSALSVFNTSMTTFIAFIANLSSPISIIAGFGLFSGIVVVANFLFVLNVHPTHIIIHHKYIAKSQKKKSARTLSELGTEKVATVELNDEEGVVVTTELNDDDEVVPPTSTDSVKQTSFEKFRSFYIHLIVDTWFPYIGLVITTTIAVVFIYFGSQLETPTTVETLYSETYFWTDFFEIFNGEFDKGSENAFTEVFAVFGIQALDRTGLKFLDANPFRGSAVFDENFDFTSEESQNFIIDVCKDLAEIECFESGCTLETVAIPETIVCSVEAFRFFFQDKFGTNESFVTRIDGTTTEFDKDDITGAVVEFLSGVGAIHATNIGVVEDEVKFVTVSFRQSMPVDQPYIIKEPVLEIFTEFEDSLIAEAPTGLDTFFITSFDISWSYTELAIVSGLFTGMALSLALSYFVILFGTRNALVSLYAIVGVACIVGSVLGTVQRFGWELGVTEAIAGVMVIGLAVDYIVHLGYMFTSAQEKLKAVDDEEKKEVVESEEVLNADMIRYSVEKMMFTILAGGATTFSAGVVLFLCTLSFFLKMAILIMFTSVYSLTFAFLFFVPLLRILGPGKK